jgi:N-acetylglucosaminyldiphosphoundecaprenol N-acetyl-beta-D-mannosaminyltransferase
MAPFCLQKGGLQSSQFIETVTHRKKFVIQKAIILDVSSEKTKRVDILGILLDVVDTQGVVDICMKAWEKKERIRIVTLNPIMVETAHKDDDIAKLISDADIVVADGVGIVWAARKLHRVTAPLVPGIELAMALIEECAKVRRPVFLIGGEEGVAVEAAEELASDRTNLRIIGTHHGYFEPEEDERVVELVNASGAHLVLCGMGFPRQDALIEKILKAGKPPLCFDGSLACEIPDTGAGLDEPPIPPMVGIGVGGSLDVFAGRVRRPAEVWRKLKLEWFARIFSQPGKRIGGLFVLLRFWWRVQFGRK